MTTSDQRTSQPPGAVHSRRAALLMLAGFAATYLPMPANLLALVALLPAVVESVRALLAIGRASGRDDRPSQSGQPGRPDQPGQAVWSGLGLLLTGC